MKKNYSLFAVARQYLSGETAGKEKTTLIKSQRFFLTAMAAGAMLFSADLKAQCTDAPLIAGVSNISEASAIVNWVAVPGVVAPTYTLEIYTDAAYTSLFNTYTGLTATTYSLTGLAAETEYFYRVKVDNTTCGDYGQGSFTAQLSYTPLAVTGFTQDVIANGTGPASGSTTSSVDNSLSAGANFAYLSMDYKLTSGSANLTYGLPVSRSLTSPSNSNLKYILQDYSSNNSLRLPNQNNFGVLQLTEPVSLSEIYLAVASGDGSSVISVEVQFTDATVQDAVTGINVTNWDSAAPADSPAIITNIGRVKRTTGVAGTGNFKVFQLMVPVTLANQSKLVSGIKITKTDTGSESKIPNVFAVSGKLISNCPSISAVSGSSASFTSGTFNWTLGSAGQGGGDIDYTLEVYTDAAYTTPVTGSPFTDITETSYTVDGLTLDTQYYYRVKANNGTCDSDYATGSFTLAYCIPTSNNGGSYYITNFTTTGGYTNIANATGSGSYNNYTTMAVAKPAGTTFNYSMTRNSVYAIMAVYVDWNQDLDFDDEGELINSYTYGFGQPTTVEGNVTIPADAALGNYRMRIRSAYYGSTTMAPCGNLSYGETEDYTIAVVEQPEDCVTPDAPTLVLSDVTASNITGTVTPLDVAPSGYLLIRSTSPELSEELPSGASYALGSVVGGGTVVATGATITTFSHFLAANTHYYYFLFAYNEGGIDCFGPIYSEPATADVTTCAIAVVEATASNITGTSANLNWSSVVGAGGSEATYTLEVYNDAALTDLMATYTVNDNSYMLTGLTTGNTYYYRVKAVAGDCGNDAWSGSSSFTVQNNYTPLEVTGFNADVIANGTGIANVSTTNAVDAVSNSYIAMNYSPVSGTVTTVGLPLNRTLTSGAIPALKFLLEDYGDNNSLRLSAQGQAGTLTLTQPVKASDVYLAVTSGSGTSAITVEIQFADGTSQIAAGISVADWYNAGTTAQPALISNIGRANRANTVGAIDPGNSKIFYITVPVNADNQSKLITSLDISKTSAGATEPVPNIFAVSAHVIDCPVLNALTAEATPDGAEFTFGASGTAEAASYSVSVYTDEEMTMAVDGSPFTAAEATYTLTGLDPFTTYYYNVAAATTVCTSNNEGSFTTTCMAPAMPVANAQTVCTGATVADLTAEGAEGASFTWYATMDGEALAEDAEVEAGSYFVSQTVGECEGPMVEVAVTINVTAVPTADAQTICTGSTVADLTATGVDGAEITWYATADGEALSEDAEVETGSYFVSQSVEGCESERVEVAVTVHVTADATTEATQTFCAGATVNDLFAEGNAIKWYADADGEVLGTDAVLESGSYFVSQTADGCESALTEVAVTVNAVPDAPTGDAAQDFDAGYTVADLEVVVTDGADVAWFIMDGDNYVAVGTDVALTDEMIYYVMQTVNGCASDYLAVTANEVLGTTPYELKGLSVYPNPASDIINIAYSAPVSQVTVTNMLGQTVLSQNPNTNEAQVNISSLAQGTYILTVQSGSKTASLKIVKQ